jgi:beta-lactamase class C
MPVMKLKCFTRFFALALFCLSASVAIAQANDEVTSLMSDSAAPFISSNKIPGVAIAIYFQGQDYYFNYGVADTKKNTPVTQDTIFELASITKVFVSTLLAVQVQVGKMSLSDPAVRYLPRLANTKGLPIDQVTMTELATHTSSFPRQMEQFGVARSDIASFINRLKAWKPEVPVGTQYKYSNIGFGFLGLVLERATGISLPVLVQQKITTPLAMQNTYFNVPKDKSSMAAQGYRPNNIMAPPYVAANLLGGGALRSSSADLLLFMKANLGIKSAQTSPALLSAMQLTQQPYFEVKPKFAMGLGWQRIQRGKELLITKNGRNQGFNTFIGFSPERKLGVVVLTNNTHGKASLLGNKILNGLLALQ